MHVCDQIERYPHLLEFQCSWTGNGFFVCFFFFFFERSQQNIYLIDETLPTFFFLSNLPLRGPRGCTPNNAADWVLNIDICGKVWWALQAWLRCNFLSHLVATWELLRRSIVTIQTFLEGWLWVASLADINASAKMSRIYNYDGGCIKHLKQALLGLIEVNTPKDVSPFFCKRFMFSAICSLSYSLCFHVK